MTFLRRHRSTAWAIDASVDEAPLYGVGVVGEALVHPLEVGGGAGVDVLVEHPRGDEIGGERCVRRGHLLAKSSSSPTGFPHESISTSPPRRSRVATSRATTPCRSSIA